MSLLLPTLFYIPRDNENMTKVDLSEIRSKYKSNFILFLTTYSKSLEVRIRHSHSIFSLFLDYNKQMIQEKEISLQEAIEQLSNELELIQVSLY